MSAAIKLCVVSVALVALVGCASAAGGIKGRPQQQADSLEAQRVQPIKGQSAGRPAQPQYIQPQGPAPAPISNIQQAIKAGPGQVAPVFNAIRVQPAPIQQQQQQLQQEPELQQQVQQQVQQQEEIDPNAAAQDNAPAIAAPAVAAAAANEEEANPRPEPYAFQYAFESGDSATSGSSQREEQQDANGRVTGFYTLKGEDGRDRRVDYVADASGFRATISTNEMGTSPKDSADVDWNAQNPTDAQLRVAESATQAARQRALLNPQIQQQQSTSGSSNNFSKLSAPRSKTSPSGAGQQQQYNNNANQQQQQQQQQQIEIVQQLQEPFEQIRQTELKGRARKSRHAPFYLFTV